jgi:hypothetical protein
MSSLGAILNRLPAFSRLEQHLVGECPLGRLFPLVLVPGSAAAFDRAWQCRWPLWSLKDGRERALPAGFEPSEQAFELFVMLQHHGHHEDLEGPWTREIHPRLDVEFGAIEETIKGGLIVLTQRASKWCPGPTFILDELAEGWKGSTHNILPPTVRTLHDERC